MTSSCKNGDEMGSAFMASSVIGYETDEAPSVLLMKPFVCVMIDLSVDLKCQVRLCKALCLLTRSGNHWNTYAGGFPNFQEKEYWEE